MFKRTKKNIIKNWAEHEEDDCIGIFLLMLEYLNRDDLSNGFSNCLGDIFQKLTEKDAKPKRNRSNAKVS